MEQKPCIDICMVCWNRPRFTEWSLKSIYQNTTTPHRVLVMDNGSDMRMQHMLHELKDLGWIDQLVLLDKNYGLETAKNWQMQFIESEYFISTDNDLLAYQYPDVDWLGRLVWLMDNNMDYGAIGCRPQILVGSGNPFAGKEDQNIIDFPHIPGYLRIMRTQLTKDMGAWCDKRELRGHEELWISERMKANGYKVGWAVDVRCHHLFGTDDTDMWGYEKGVTPESHGHNPVSHIPQNDKDEVLRDTGIQI